MRLYWEVTRLALQRQLTYRAATLAGLATNVFFGLLRAAVLVALYGARNEVAGMSIQDAITYTGLTQGLIAFLAIFGWYELMTSVYNGQIGSDLLRPIGFFRFWLSQDLGRAVITLLFRGVTIMIIYALIFDITVPTGPGQWLSVALALGFAWLVSFAWRYLVNLAAFWTPDARGVARFAFGLAWILSGFFMPLRFFPDWFLTLCNLTPFPSMVNTPVEIYLGLLSGPELAQALTTQLVWAAALIIAGQVAMNVGLRRLVIQGG